MSRLKSLAMALEPSLWGTLPKELLYLVFARLPVAGIGQLRVLSKEWTRNVDCKDSEFNQVLDATAHFKMFGLLCKSEVSGSKLAAGHIYDVQANKWHAYVTDAELTDASVYWDRADGGLVCCTSSWSFCFDKIGIFFIVINPLTKQKAQLPPMFIQLPRWLRMGVTRMVKFTVDKKTKEYKVFVVYSILNDPEGFFAQVYDSHIKEWTVVERTHGHILGWDIFNSPSRHQFPCSILVYNCADGTLQSFIETDIVPRLEVEVDGFVLLEGHLFVLHEEASADPLEDGASMPPKYCISEFYLPEKATAWVKLRVHNCGPCKLSDRARQHGIYLTLLGCAGFLLVYGVGSHRAWLYNLSTCEWRTLPTFGKPLYPEMMMTISWSAVP